MIIKFSLNADGFIGRLRGYNMSQRAKDRTNAAAAGATVFARAIVDGARRDTQRYVRAWAQANNLAGLPAIPVPELRPSKYAATYLAILGDQVDAFAARVSKYENLIEARFRRVNRPMRGKYYNELNAALQRAYTRLERAREELKNAAKRHAIDMPDYLFMGLLNKEGQYRPMVGKNTRGRTARQLATIRTKVYGGSGEAVVNEGVSIFVLTNREPHARLLEHKYNYVRLAMQAVRGFGVRRMSSKYVGGMRVGLMLKGNSNA